MTDSVKSAAEAEARTRFVDYGAPSPKKRARVLERQVAFVSGAEWQREQDESEAMKVAAQRTERIRELEAERDMARQEYHELEEFHRLYIDPYKGDDGGIEAAKSYLIGRLRELNRIYKQRAKHAEARLDKVRAYVETLSAGSPLGSNWMRWADQAIVRLRSILDGES